MLPLMTSEVKLYLMKNLRLYNVSIYRNFFQDRFINEYARKKKAKMSEIWKNLGTFLKQKLDGF